MSSIQVQTESNHIATLTFNRPSMRNALDWPAMELFAHTIEAIAREEHRILILTGAGGAEAAEALIKQLRHASD